jgi:tRNA-Thr(GGU) m(6)t(6)A37 methyltransferase TsaA
MAGKDRIPGPTIDKVLYSSVRQRCREGCDGNGELPGGTEAKMRDIKYDPIGIIHSPYHEIEGMPIQPCAATGVRGTVEIKREYAGGLKDIDGFSHIILIYHLHVSKGFSLEVIPFLDDQPKGVFATRAPKRPNPIGLSIVKLIKAEDNILHIENVDILDNTPLLDIKPYVSQFDVQDQAEMGWYSKAKYNVRDKKSDLRFK